MHGIEVRMLGTLGITMDGKPLSFSYEKPKALCAYLMVEGRPFYREHIAGLFWPNMSTENSRQNLRQSLAVIRRAFGEEYAKLFNVNRQMIEFVGYQLCTIDTEHLKMVSQSVGSSTDLMVTRDGVTLFHNLYRGQFCHGLTLQGCNEINHWLEVRRHEFKMHALSFARNLINWFRNSNQINHAIEIYRKIIAMERYDEQLVREYMEFLVECGRRVMAIDIYRDHEKHLRMEYGTRPDARLAELHDYLTKENAKLYSRY